MNVNVKYRLGYKDFFNDEPKKIEFYLEKIPHEIVLASMIIGFANPNKIFHDPKYYIKSFLPEYMVDELLSKLRKNYQLFDIISCLRIAELFLKNKTEIQKDVSDSEQRISLLKLVLTVNDELKSDENTLKEKIGNKSFQYSIASFFYRYDLEYFGYDQLGVIQILKSVEFFTYISNTEKLQPHLTLFLSKYDLNNWQEWVLNLIYFVSILISDDFKKNTFLEIEVPNNKLYKKNCHFYNALSINSKLNGEFKKDFKILRKYPVYKIEEGLYLIISDHFFIEKIYDNLQSTFIEEISKNVSDEKKVNFKSISGEDFSERTLLYDIMKRSFPNEWKHISGSYFKSKGYKDSEPDYYLRFNDKVFLFECKDVSLTGFVKQSFDYSKIEEGLRRKFYKESKSNGKLKKRAILQILENIKRVNNNFFKSCDDDFDGKKVEIYPILVTHNRQFDCPGINNLLNHWLKDELANNTSEIVTKNVNRLTLINIEIFLLWYKAIKQRDKFVFEKLIDEYHKNATNEIVAINQKEQLQKEVESNISFTYFFKEKMKSKGILKTNLNDIKDHLLPKES